MNHFLKSKYKRIIIVLFVIVVTAIASSFITYSFTQNKETNAAPISIWFENTADADRSTEIEAFNEEISYLKQEAKRINHIEQEDRWEIINDIGESLKSLLTDYPDLLTNAAFNSEELSVMITEYPLKENQVLRKLDYTLTYNDLENGFPVKEKRFFLQFSGAQEFFSEIEYVSLNTENFFVFENKDGCFAFSLYADAYHTIYNINDSIKQYKADLFMPDSNTFLTERYIDIPLKLTQSDHLSLVQEGDLIKTTVSNNEFFITCEFDHDTSSFVRSEKAIQKASIDYDMPKLFLGLSDSQGKLRTLLIYKEEDEIKVDEYRDQIIILRDNKPFTLKHYVLEKELYESDSETGEEWTTGSLNIKKLLCAPTDLDFSKLEDDFNKLFDVEETWTFYDSLDIPFYIGENYICYLQSSFHSGGGTFRIAPDYIRFDKLDNLSDFTYDGQSQGYGGMVPDFKEQTLSEVIYGNKAKRLYQSDISSYGYKTNPYVDFTQLSLKRNLGKWSLMLPVMEEYYHPGNGSYSNWIKTFAAYSNDVPDFLKTEEEIIELGGWNNWYAKDFFKFPNSNAALFQYDYYIGIRDQESDLGSNDYDIYIPVEIDESIVSINFSIS